MSEAGATLRTPPEGELDHHAWRDRRETGKTGTIGVLYKGTRGELILFIKEEEHFEAVIKDDVTCTSAHTENFAFTFLLWKHLARTC